MTRTPAAVLFDLDGTLVEGRDAIWDAFSFALATAGAPAVARERVEALIGHPLDEMFLRLVPGCGVEDAVRLVALYQARFLERAPGLVRLTPGALDALDAFDGVPLAVVTTKLRGPAELVLRALGILDRFATIVGRDDAPHMKPHPAPVLEAARRLGVPVHRAVMVGDTTFDAEAARAAGARFVGVLCGVGTEAELRGAGARVLVPDLSRLAEVLPSS